LTAHLSQSKIQNPKSKIEMKLGIVCDYLEEGWISMDICAQMLVDRSAQIPDSEIQPVQIRPPFEWRLKNWEHHLPKYFNGNRFINRFIDYPQYLKPRARDCDLFHVADHSYGHLIHSLPAAKTGVFCADLDAFQSILEPKKYPRSWAYRQMSQHILTGMQKAAIVFCPTAEIRRQIEYYQLIDPAKLIIAAPGVSVEYQLNPLPPDKTIIAVQERLQGKPFILHVGSCIPRKRIDVLLATFAKLRAEIPELHLVKVGGDWSVEQQQQIADLVLENSIVHLKNLPNSTIASLYQQAKIVLMTSEAEGFGMPVSEALACGSIVLASDIPVLREVGGDAAIYSPVGDINTWVTNSLMTITTPHLTPSLDRRQARAAYYTWDNYARTIVTAYSKLAI
jgi:glycosyltransferase involved in cell wall biosynthesis